MGYLDEQFDECMKMLVAGQTGVLNQGMQDLVCLLLVSLGCHLKLVQRDIDAAYDYLQACRARSARVPNSHWSKGLHWWADMEHAKALGDQRRELLSRQAMERSALTGEYRPLALLARKYSAGMDSRI